MAANTYDIGDIARLTVNFTSTAGVPANPNSLNFEVESPSGAITTTSSTSPSVQNPVIGRYTLDVPITLSGVWEYRVASAGAVIAAGENWFRVLPKRVST